MPLVVQFPATYTDDGNEQQTDLYLEMEMEDIELGDSPKKNAMRRGSNASNLINPSDLGSCPVLLKQVAVAADGNLSCASCMDSPMPSSEEPSTMSSIRKIIFGAAGVYLSYVSFSFV